MKPQFEISKNVILLLLLSIIGAMGTYIVLGKIVPTDVQKVVKIEKDTVYVPTIKEVAVDNSQEIDKLNKKLKFYRKYYRDHQSVETSGWEVRGDTIWINKDTYLLNHQLTQ